MQFCRLEWLERHGAACVYVPMKLSLLHSYIVTYVQQEPYLLTDAVDCPRCQY